MSERRPIRLPFTLLCTLSLILGCSGGGGGGTNGPTQGTTGTGYGLAPSTGPGDVSAFFPTGTGDRWFFNTNKVLGAGNVTTSLGTLLVVGPQQFNGVQGTAFRQRSSDGGVFPDDFYLKSAGGITYLGNSDATDWLTATIGPYQELRFPAVLGSVADFTRTGYAISSDLDGDGKPESLTAHVTVNLAAFESVTVPAGTFDGVARLVSTLSGSVKTTQAGTTLPFSATQTRWAAPGVGVVRQDQSLTVNGATTESSSQARGYQVGGVKHGLGLPATLSKGLIQGDSNSADPGRPGVSAGPQGFLALTTWVTGTGARRLKAVLFDGTGTPVEVDATPTRATALTNFGQAAAFDGSNHLAVISQNDNSGTYPPLLGLRLSPTGTLLDPAGFVIAPAGGFIPAVAAGGGGCLVAYSRYDNTSHHHRVYGVKVGGDGTVGAEILIMALPDSSLYGCAVAFDGSNFLVACSGEHLGAGPTTWSTYGARVSASGTVLDSTPLTLVDAPCAPGYPALAFGGGSYLLAWADTRPGAPGVYAARVSMAGALLDGTPGASGFLVSASGGQAQGDPAVAFNGTHHLLCWSLGSYPSTSVRPCITGLKVNPGGTLAGLTFPVSDAPPNAGRLFYPMLATSTQGTACVWLVNNEMGGTVKEVDGVVAW